MTMVPARSMARAFRLGTAVAALLVALPAGAGVTAESAVWRNDAAPLPGLSGFLCTPQHWALLLAKASLTGPVQVPRTEGFKPGYQLLAAAQAAETAAPADRLPLSAGLGNSSLKVTTGSPEAQAWFDQGLKLAWAFNHEEAVAAFRAAQAADPTCAMCYWGEAFALGPNINAPMMPQAVGPAFAAIAQAKALGSGASELERALIEALAARYSPDPNADRAALDSAWADALAGVVARFPESDEAQVLFADALMNLQPWDYWAPDKQTPKGRTAEQVAALETVLQRNPTHAAAIHLYIHSVEASTTPERAEPYAEKLAAQAPEAGHLVHMPAHIYYRVGRYADSLKANVDAVAVDEAYFAKVKSSGNYVYKYTYYPHNVHFVLVSAARAGDAATAVAAAHKLAGVISDDVTREVASVEAIKQAPYFALAEFGEPDAVLAEPAPSPDFPFVVAAWHYARAQALIRQGDLAAAEAEAKQVAAIAAGSDFSKLEAWLVPAKPVLEIADLVLQGGLARARGDLDAAIAAFTTAALRQDALPYMEPTYWYYPIRRSQGAVLLQAGHAAEAAQAFEQALQQARNDAASLWGLAQARAAQGDESGAADALARFEKAWAGGAARPDLGQI
jgi:tetratricopeptide (TPR) repeat protein